jgi:hypothetical protein
MNGIPRWKTVLGVLAAIALIALFVVLHVTDALGPKSH